MKGNQRQGEAMARATFLSDSLILIINQECPDRVVCSRLHLYRLSRAR